MLQGGVGNGLPGIGQVDWADFAKLYLDPANLAGAEPLADQPGKVAKTYDRELIAWLKQRFGYTGDAPLAYFNALAGAQQRIFLRQARIVGQTIAGGVVTAWRDFVPYFWSDLHGARLQMLGSASGADNVSIVHEDKEKASFSDATPVQELCAIVPSLP